MKEVKIIAAVIGCTILCVVSFIIGAATQKIEDDKNLMSLRKSIEEKDSIISDQSEYIIELTYQHEDDAILVEYEQP